MEDIQKGQRMNTDMEQQIVELKKKAQNRLENWPLLNELSHKEQLDTVRDFVCSKIVNISQQGDLVQEVYVVDAVYDLVVEALQSPILPEEFEVKAPDGTSVSREILVSDFDTYCKGLTVRPTSFDNLIKPEATELEQFIYFVTGAVRRRNFLDSWDEGIKLSETIRSNGYPGMPTYEQKELLYFFMETFKAVTRSEMQAQMNQSKIELATAAQSSFSLD